jgi:hypothetical protein
MEAARTSETSVDIQLKTQQYIPEDSELQINKVHTLPPYFLKIHYNSVVQLAGRETRPVRDNL